MEGYSDDPVLVVADIVGPTVLAQGTAAGRRCATIRLGGCNLSCSWCDAPFTWDSTRYDLARHLSQWPASQVAATALSCDPPLVVVSGGEPLLQQRQPGWPVLLRSLQGVEVGLETNGTIAPSEETLRGVSWVTVSPKLAHAGDPSWERIKGDVLLTWGRLAHDHDIEFLFVVRDSGDVATINTLVLVHGLPPSRVWISPEGSTMPVVVGRLYEVAEAALTAGFNVAPRIVNPFGDPAATREPAAGPGVLGTPGPAAGDPGPGQGPGGGGQTGQGDAEARPPAGKSAVGSRFRRT